MNIEHQEPEAGGSPVDCQVRPLVERLRASPMTDTQADRIDRMRMAADKIEMLTAALQGLLNALPSAHLSDEPPPRLSDLADALLLAKAVAVDALRRYP